MVSLHEGEVDGTAVAPLRCEQETLKVSSSTSENVYLLFCTFKNVRARDHARASIKYHDTITITITQNKRHETTGLLY